jgi:membrane-associated phospholipid phosphatase
LQHHLLTIISAPWFSDWNHRLLEALFRFLPHTASREDWFEFWIANPLIGTWFFAAFFYSLWSIDDEQQLRRREILFRALVAIAVACLLTLAIRPWIKWPSPLRDPAFQGLFPRYFWGGGSMNCFPSHSTLVYFTVAAGFWPLRRSLSVALALFALISVSLTRIYLGGHYPVDVLFSIVLGLGSLAAVSQWRIPASVSRWLTQRGLGTTVRDWLLFLWIFELGEGFRGTEFMVGLVHAMRHKS